MKKIVATAILAAVVGLAAPAHATWQSDLNTAISSGNTAQINQIAAANPDAQGEMALTIMSSAKSMLSTNPGQAAKLYAAAAPFAGEISTASAPTAAGYVSTFVTAAKSESFQSANPQAGASIFSTSLTISSQPTVTAAAPGLYATTLVASNTFLANNPEQTALNQTLQSQVLLAQGPISSPNNLTGPQTPQENQNIGREEAVFVPPASAE